MHIVARTHRNDKNRYNIISDDISPTRTPPEIQRASTHAPTPLRCSLIHCRGRVGGGEDGTYTRARIYAIPTPTPTTTAAPPPPSLYSIRETPLDVCSRRR